MPHSAAQFELLTANRGQLLALITEITGSTHTPIKVVGDADIGNGNLKIELNGYTPTANDVWMLIQTGSDLADDIQQIDLDIDLAGYEPLIHEDPEFQGTVNGEFAGIDDALAPLPLVQWQLH